MNPGPVSPAPNGASRPASVRLPLVVAFLALCCLAFALGGAGVRPVAAAQLQAPEVSSPELGLLLRQMDGERRVLMIAAHPDDEDTSLLATLALGDGVRAAYLSLTRGEGGQNLIGPELEEGLGIIRTGELLAARSLDGAEQYFARAFDFGYSRSADETFDHWPREELVRDVVQVIREFRPHVVVSIFTGTSADGHGQHQAAGMVAEEAYHAAADSLRFRDQLRDGLEPWTPGKLYRSTRFRSDATTLEVPTGRLDPLVGRSHFQVAMASRSRHRSQDMGSAETPGPRSAGLELVDARTGFGGADDGLFAGIDTTLAGVVGRAFVLDGEGGPAREFDRVMESVEAYRSAVHRAERELRAADPGAVLSDLVEARAALEGAIASASSPELRDALQRRMSLLSETILMAGSVVVELRVDRAAVVPGDTLEVDALLWNAGESDWRVTAVTPELPPGWEWIDGGPDAIDPGAEPLPSGTLVRRSYGVRVPADAEPSRLYYLAEERDGSMYRWPDDLELRTRPGNPPLIRARVALEGPAGAGPPPTDSGVSGPARDKPAGAQVLRAAAHVAVDKELGEFRVPLHVVPVVSVSVDPARMAWPASRPQPRDVSVRVLAGPTESELRGELHFEAPAGWQVDPAHAAFRLEPGSAGGAEVVLPFRIQPPDGVGSGAQLRLTAEARLSDGRRYRSHVRMIDYPHLDPVPFHEPAALAITHLPVRVAEGLRVGYLMGPGDEGMRALRDLGVEVEALDRDGFRQAALSDFDAVVLGIRAYETREDLVAANHRLLEYARDGGTVVVQYNKYELPDGGFAPYPLAMSRPHDRVTDPDAPVRLLVPEHPLLSSPNRITEADFEGWVQERGLYFLSEWDERYVPLLEMSDPGREANRGSLVVARVGEGAWVYTGLALFRQIPKGVPGAFRLLANLVSLRGDQLPASSQTEPDR